MQNNDNYTAKKGMKNGSPIFYRVEQDYLTSTHLFSIQKISVPVTVLMLTSVLSVVLYL